MKAGKRFERVVSRGVESEMLGGKRWSIGVENSSSVLAAASIELSHRTSAKLEEAIHCVRAEMYSVSRDLNTGERCWITVRVPLEKTV